MDGKGKELLNAPSGVLMAIHDSDTFVRPNTVFGFSTALWARLEPGSMQYQHIGTTIQRLPFGVFFDWANRLIFDFAS